MFASETAKAPVHKQHYNLLVSVILILPLIMIIGLPIEKQIMARPNILMFGDAYWLPGRTADQEDRFYEWFKLLRKQPVVVVEIGAGLAVPTIRNTSQGIIKHSKHEDSYLIRINPNEPQVIRPVDFALPMNCLDALEAIDAYMD